MNKLCPWLESRVLCGALTPAGDGAVTLECPPEGFDYLLYDRGQDRDICLTDYACLQLTARGLHENSQCFQWAFYEKDCAEPTLRLIFGILPGVETPVPFDFSLLDSQTLFPPRTPGRLKMTIFGKPIRLSDVHTIRLQTPECFEVQRIFAKPCVLMDRMPEITLPRRQLIDDLGQWVPKDWPGKVADRAACTALLRAMDAHAAAAPDAFSIPGWDRFGGLKDKKFTATGFFHVEKADGRYYLADPDGNAFLSTGVDCINPGVETRIDPMEAFIGDAQRELLARAREGNPPQNDPVFSLKRGSYFYSYGIANLIAAFGDGWHDAWARIVKRHLKSWGMNTIGNWSSLDFIRRAGMPYVLPLDAHAPAGFPTTKTRIFRDFPDVFSDEYAQSCEVYAQALLSFRDDPNLIGYFMRNEPEWAFVYDLRLAEELLANPAPLASREWLIAQLREKYANIGALNAAWQTAFSSFDDLRTPISKAASLSAQAARDLAGYSEQLISRYVTLPAQALRRVDSHHLNLGMRYAYITDPSLLAGSECFDVFSINSYQTSPYNQIEYVGKLLDKPVMIGEFHHGALDCGLTAHGIRGVRTQKDRGDAYRYYLEQAARSRYFVGAHYFQLNDQSCLGRFDGENYQIGLIDVCMQPYAPMAEGMKAAHSVVYDVAMGKRKAFAAAPEDLPPIHY